MPVGVKLIDLRRDLRAETGQSLNAAQGTNSQPTQDIILDRQQRELWGRYEWPHLAYWQDMPVVIGQALYDYPPELPFDTINRIYYVTGSEENWKEIEYGLHAYSVRPSPQAGWPPRRWGNVPKIVSGKTIPAGQMMLVPTPSSDGTLRIAGQAPINPLVGDNDECVIDSKAIVLFAAAEILATQKVEAAQLKLTKAQNYLRRLLANQSADKRRMYTMSGYSTQRSGVPYIDYIPSGV